MDYSSTINLPKTDFPMRASLPQREPEMLKYWDDMKIYEKINEHREGAPLYILHDGPPYSNGSIHLGQTLNKILKDIVVKFKTISGFHSPFIPGWDTHGLPNELATLKKHKMNPTKVSPVELREKCAEHALSYQQIQKGQFQRLGVLADWEHPYITLTHDYEATIIKVFGKMAEKGMIYRGLKPVHWCPKCVTALAEAEIEYADKRSDSIFVRFLLPERKGIFPEFTGTLYFMIWTTTPWTLPANVAIALSADADYTVLKVGDDGYIVAKELVDKVVSGCGFTEYSVIGTLKGSELEGLEARHPFIDRVSKIITAPYVEIADSDTAGTGCVHTAPGHGREDFESGQRYSLPTLVPVDELGKMTEEAGQFAGLFYKDANEAIKEHLKEIGALVGAGYKDHSYPHCWRCHGPVIFRATRQWFVKVDADQLRKKALSEIDKTHWIPDWGHDRIYNMVEGRPDWCLSRQRTWGTPIPAVHCEECEEVIFTPDLISAVEKLFAKEGSDSWYKRELSEILPEGFKCPHCGSTKLRKETDIFDVWFDSSVSHEVVLNTRLHLNRPADLYLEGGDQHRGWFQVSLLTGVAMHDRAPFKSVLTHGWVLDGHGIAMHKSMGNVIDPADMVKKYGAEILRLFVASVDYTADMRFSDDALRQISEVYKKIRNSCRFLLGNLYDFDPKTDTLPRNELQEIDRWILSRKDQLLEKMQEAYDAAQFHVVYYYLQHFCSSDLSAIYMDIVKDRLYTSKANSFARRSAQTAMYEMLYDLVVVMSPILSFTAEEIWRGFFKEKSGIESVFLADWPATRPSCFSEEESKQHDRYSALRDEIYADLEELRKNKEIRQSLEAAVTLQLSDELYEQFTKNSEYLKSFFIVSQLKMSKDLLPDGKKSKVFDGVSFKVTHAAGEKCIRCWNYFEGASYDSNEPLCHRCSEVLQLV